MIGVLTPDGPKALILRGVRMPGGNKGIAAGSILTPGGGRQLWDGSVSALTVTATPEIVQGAQGLAASIPVATRSTTASVVGGSPPYTYAWTLLSDDGLGGAWTVLSPDSATAAFRASAIADGAESTATFRCTVTDARGATGTADVTAVARNYGDISRGGIPV